MSKEQAQNDLSMWLSTYGLITAERILERYKIKLQPQELLNAIKNPNTFYHRLLRVPLKNVFNGIILQQAQDYQVYAQKLFIDYLLSGESGKSEESPGDLAREDLEKERKNLIKMDEEFQHSQLAHEKLIAVSQKSLIQYANNWQKKLSDLAKKIKTELQQHGINKEEALIVQAISAFLIQNDSSEGTTINLQGESWARVEQILGQSVSTDARQIFVEQIRKLGEFTAEIEGALGDFVNQTSDMSMQLRKWRSSFYNLILKTNELIKLLPEYQANSVQDQENRESLHFDAEIGEQES